MTTRLAGTIFTALALCGCATTKSPPPARAADTSCLTATGSRIPDPQTHCTGYGRSYSQTDIDRTGHTTVAGALPLLDPSITVSH
jgi:hypothetical protein